MLKTQSETKAQSLGQTAEANTNSIVPTYNHYAHLKYGVPLRPWHQHINFTAVMTEGNEEHYWNMFQQVRNSWEHPYYWYYVVYKPFNKGYNQAWALKNTLERTTKDLKKKSEVIVGTLEIEAKKVHSNFLIATNDPPKDNINRLNRFRIKVIKLEKMTDRIAVFNYMCKEMTGRSYQRYKDYVTWSNPDLITRYQTIEEKN